MSNNHNIISDNNIDNNGYNNANNDEDDDDVIYQQAFDECQSTLLLTQTQDAEKVALRKELDAYVKESQSKRGSDGKLLLSVPDNFAVIAESMSRQDLLSEDTAPWSKYLLDSKFGSDFDRAFGGRYNSVLQGESNESKLKRGLAEIHMLDSQLSQVSRKAAAVKKQGFLTSLFVDDSAAPSEITSAATTPRSTAPSINSHGGKATFMTRVHGSNSRRDNKDDVSSPTSRMSTARVDETPPKAIEDNVQEQSEHVEDGIDTQAEAARNFIKDNIAAVKSRSRLTEEQEYRVQSLIDCDESAFDTVYGLTEEQTAALQSIDSALEKYNHTSRLLEDETLPTVIAQPEGSEDGKKSENYLAKQRATKSKKNYEAAIDLQLSVCQEPTVDLSGLVEVSSASIFSSRNEKQASKLSTPSVDGIQSISSLELLELPSDPSKIRAARLVTMQDINQVLDQIRSFQFWDDVPNEFSLESGNSMVSISNQSNTDLSIQPQQSASSSTGGLRSTVRSEISAERPALDKLYQSLRSDVEKLSELRKKPKTADVVAQATSRPRSEKIWAGAEKLLKIKDDLDWVFEDSRWSESSSPARITTDDSSSQDLFNDFGSDFLAAPDETKSRKDDSRDRVKALIKSITTKAKARESNVDNDEISMEVIEKKIQLAAAAIPPAPTSEGPMFPPVRGSSGKDLTKASIASTSSSYENLQLPDILSSRPSSRRELASRGSGQEFRSPRPQQTGSISAPKPAWSSSSENINTTNNLDEPSPRRKPNTSQEFIPSVEARHRLDIDHRIKLMQERIEAMLGKSDRQILEEQIGTQLRQDQAAADILAADTLSIEDSSLDNPFSPENISENERFVIM